MPREQINYPNAIAVLIDKDGNELDYVTGNPVAPNEVVCPDPALHVHWNPGADGAMEANVQVSLEIPKAMFAARAGRLDESVSATSVFSPALSRQEINKLIRVLRNARDKAYGRDE